MINIESQSISISDLRKVSGIGSKTIERIKEQLEQNELVKQYVNKYNEDLHLDVNKIHLGDCLELMNGIPDGSVDMILCDLPYGTTACAWDDIIPFDKLWKQYRRVIKDNGVVVLFGSEPFSSSLRMSNINNYKYDWKWDKNSGSNFVSAKYQPLRIYEDVCVFYKNTPIYNPQMVLRDKSKFRVSGKSKMKYNSITGTVNQEGKISSEYKYPTNKLNYDRMGAELNSKHRLHPTQKPVALLEYLIKTYTNEEDLILDNCMGSGTTAIAAINTNRNYIGIEIDEDYYKISNNRINEHLAKTNGSY